MPTPGLAQPLRAVARSRLLLRESLRDDLVVRRLARRIAGKGIPPSIGRPPQRPVGVKLELTYRCNLKCPFCYTDSPRRTRERALDLSDQDWRKIADQALALGVIEAVVTGGEPLLRRKLALELIEKLAAEGVGVTLNTNGWFVDDEVADRLARCSGVQANISLDGATPELHDAARGVRGSWERAVEAVDRLLGRGARLRLIHVVTPANERYVRDFLEHMWLLGAHSIRLAATVPIGAAARSGDWSVDLRALRRTTLEYQERYGDRLALRPGTLAGLAFIEDVPPASLLVRPNGDVLIDSLQPFEFGNAVEGSLAECWRRIAESWPDPRIVEWAGSISSPKRLPQADLVPYRDEEVSLARIGGGNGSKTQPVEFQKLPVGVPFSADAPGDLGAARARVVELALSRRYRLAPVRWTGSEAKDRFVRVLGSGRISHLNEAACVVMDACADGPAADAVDVLASRHPGLPRKRLEQDVLDSVGRLLERGILEPALA